MCQEKWTQGRDGSICTHLLNWPMILLEIFRHAYCQNMAKFDRKTALLTGHGVLWLHKWFMRVAFRFKLSITTKMCIYTSSLLSAPPTNPVAMATVIPNQIQDISCLSEPSAAWRYSNLWSPSPWCHVSPCPGTHAQLCFGDHNKRPWLNEYW